MSWRGGKADFAIPRLGSLQDLVSTAQSHAQVPKCGQREHFHLLHSKLSGQSRHHLETPARGNRSPIGRLRRDIRVPAPLSARRHGPSTTTAIATSRVPVHSLSLLSSKLCDGKIVTNTNVVDAIATIKCPFSNCFQQCDYDYLLRTDAKGRAHGPPHLGAGVGSAAFDAPGRRLGRPCSVPDAPKGRCTSAA